jgi:hypothetical protein
MINKHIPLSDTICYNMVEGGVFVDNLEFRKFLTTYGMDYAEYQQLDETKKQELLSKFKSETKSDNLSKIGKGMQGLGCLIMLIPILLILLFLLFAFIKNMF